MDERDNFTEVQAILTELYEAYRSKSGMRRISDNKFANMMHIKPVTWNTYINGFKVPSLANALQIGEYIAKYLGEDARGRFLRLCGHELYYRINEPQLKFIVEEWEYLDSRTRREIHEHVQEMQQKRIGGPPSDK